MYYFFNVFPLDPPLRLGREVREPTRCLLIGTISQDRLKSRIINLDPSIITLFALHVPRDSRANSTSPQHLPHIYYEKKKRWLAPLLNSNGYFKGFEPKATPTVTVQRSDSPQRVPSRPYNPKYTPHSREEPDRTSCSNQWNKQTSPRITLGEDASGSIVGRLCLFRVGTGISYIIFLYFEKKLIYNQRLECSFLIIGIKIRRWQITCMDI